MDGAGFIHTDPQPDPDTVIGVAGVTAYNDEVEILRTTATIRLDVLANDLLPEGAQGLRIKSVSDTLQGAKVRIAANGQRLVYTRDRDKPVYDSFYYIVEDDQGRLGKADVVIREEHQHDYGGGGRPVDPGRSSSNDSYTLFEDAPETTLDVLDNDYEYRAGEIVAVDVQPGLGGTVRIAEDGKSLRYQPPAAQTGHDLLHYTVRRPNGDEATFSVSVRVRKPVEALSETYPFRFDIDAGPFTLDVLGRDRFLSDTPWTPRIAEVSAPEVAGELQIAGDGESLVYQPAAGFHGTFQLAYTLRYGPEDHQTVTGYETVVVHNTFLAVDDWFTTTPGEPIDIDVLANDPLLPRHYGYYFNGYRQPPTEIQLELVDVVEGSAGGAVEIVDGKLRYTPAAGFAGDETFVYTVRDSNGHLDFAEVTMHVAEAPAVDGLPRFTLPGQLQQFLIDQAVEVYRQQFGQTQRGYLPRSNSIDFLNATGHLLNRDMVHTAALTAGTNVQEAGVDEADIAETDGRYVYSFAHGQLAIIDLDDPTNPRAASFTKFDDVFDEMYLQGDRLTLLRRGGKDDPAVVAVVDVSDRSDPALVERTEITGRIVDSRAVGDRVFIAVSGIELPPPEIVATESDGESWEYRTYETLDQYVARVKESIIDVALPTYRTLDAAGKEVSSGLLTDPGRIYRPVGVADNELLSLATFDVGDGNAGPDHTVGVFSSQSSVTYMAGDAFYVLGHHAGETTIFKFAVAADGAADLVATGVVGGAVLNQFSVDEHDGLLRVATTEVDQNTSLGQRRFSSLRILQQQGDQLVVVGELTNLAPTETIKSVRFLDDRTYVTTFRVVDPLFVIDLSEATQPKLVGALKIPGYSDYLHPVGEDYVIGIGRDADEITGRLGPLQVSLFFVGAGDPTLVDQVTLDGAGWHASEAWFEHHAVAYFADEGVLTLPITWNEQVQIDDDGDGAIDRWESKRSSAIWAFEIATDGAGDGSIDLGGSVEHETDANAWGWAPGNAARRSLRIGDALVTLSDDILRVNRLHDVAEPLGEVWLGDLPVDDNFTVAEDSGATQLDVLANDRPGVGGVAPSIVSAIEPVAAGYSRPGHFYWGDPRLLQVVDSVGSIYQPAGVGGEPAGTVEISEDGRSLVFTPREDFFGTATFTYTVYDEVRGEQSATVTVSVTPVADAPRAVDDEFEVAADVATHLDVMQNDVDPDPPMPWRPVATIDDDAPIRSLDLTTDVNFTLVSNDVLAWTNLASLQITEVSAGDQGGTTEIGPLGKVIYTPAEGFTGLETFTYTVTNASGMTDEASVSVWVGVPKPENPATALAESVTPELAETAAQIDARPVLLSADLFAPARGAARASQAMQQDVAASVTRSSPVASTLARTAAIESLVSKRTTLAVTALAGERRAASSDSVFEREGIDRRAADAGHELARSMLREPPS